MYRNDFLRLLLKCLFLSRTTKRVVILSRFRLVLRIAASVLPVLMLIGCGTKQTAAIGTRIKTASLNAVTDPVTWAPFAGGMLLYATGYDDKITNYYKEHHWTGLYDSDADDVLRDLNGVIMVGTALIVPEKKWQKTAKRVIVEVGTTQVVILASDGLKNNIDKETPDGKNNDAIGSFHATIPFADSAMTRRNVALTDLPKWADYSIIGASYLTATVSALVRVEEEGHSFADQMVSASVGNFIGLFMHDLFLLRDDVTLQTTFTPKQSSLMITYRY